MAGSIDNSSPKSRTGFPGGLPAFLSIELAPYPGRMEMALMTAMMCAITVILEEMWQIPLMAYSTYIVFFASERESTSSILNGMMCIVGTTVAVAVSLGGYVISIGEPALRLPLMGVIIFLTMFLMRVFSLGPLALGIGFVVSMSLTMVDSVPHALPMVEDFLAKRVLWLWTVGTLPFALIVLVNAIMGRRPEKMLAQGISERLRVAGEALSGGMTPELRSKIAYYTGCGPDQMLATLNRGGIFNRSFALKKESYEKYLSCAIRILRLTQEWDKAALAGQAEPVGSRACGPVLIGLARNIGRGNLAAVGPDYDETGASGQAGPDKTYLSEIVRTLNILSDIVKPAPRSSHEKTGNALLSIASDAMTNPDYSRFALKATLAILIAYLSYSIVDWPGIRTCMVTCFFVSLSSLGESAHKLALRIAGALIGCSFGMLSILFLVPHMTDVGQLAILIAAVSFLASWVMFSSDRLSYAGMQIAMAFFFCVLVGYGPSIDLAEARDRVIGILWGNIIISAVFSLIWPVSALARARQIVASALMRMSAVVTSPASHESLLKLESELAQVHKLLTLDPFEPAILKEPHRRLQADSRLILAMSVPVQVVSSYAAAPPDAGETVYRRELGRWLEDAAGAIKKNAGTGSLSPVPRHRSGDRWYGELDRRAAELEESLKMEMEEEV